MIIETTRFGRIEIDPDRVIIFPRGLVGFLSYHKFCILEGSPDMPFRWLQSLEDPSLAFPLVQPHFFFTDYKVEICDQDAECLEARSRDDVLVFTTISFRRTPDGITTNLLGPIVIGTKKRIGLQIIQDAEKYSTKHPLPVGLGAPKEPSLEPAA